MNVERSVLSAQMMSAAFPDQETTKENNPRWPYVQAHCGLCYCMVDPMQREAHVEWHVSLAKMLGQA